MVLSATELISMIRTEVRILLHLISKVEPAHLDYRPSPQQRSVLELLQYLTIVGPIQAKLVHDGVFDMTAFMATWNHHEAEARTRNLPEIKTTLAAFPAEFEALATALSDSDFRAEISLFGNQATRGAFMVWLVQNHFVAYRMQLFLYLKACGLHDLNTMNLWAGVDQRLA